jgi:hypothetical protein
MVPKKAGDLIAGQAQQQGAQQHRLVSDPNEGASINQQITQRATAKGGCSQEFEAQQGVLANRGHGAHPVFAVYMFLNALNPAEWVKPTQA